MRILRADWVVLTLRISMILKSYLDFEISPIPKVDIGFEDS